MLFDSKSFCPVPWVSTCIYWHGEVKNCCVSSALDSNLTKDSLVDIRNGEINREIKRRMLAGEEVGECIHCHNGTGPQQDFINKFSNLPNEFFKLDKSNELYNLELWLETTCNFGCVYCEVDNSTFLAKEASWKSIIPHLSLDSRKTVINDLNFKNLRYLMFGGGEPLLSNSTIDALDKLLIESPNATVVLETNLSILQPRAMDLLGKFKVEWIVSAEAMGEQYNYIRYKGDWDKLVNNLNTIRQNKNTRSIKFNLILTSLNTGSILEFIKFIESEGYHDAFILHRYEKHVDWDDALDARHLPDPHLLQLLDAFKNADHSYSPKCFARAITVMEKLLSTKFDKRPDLLIQYLSELDERRNLDSKIVFPELYKLLEGKNGI